MGQRSPTETLFGIVAAFIERRTWTQADLARRLETRPETIRKRLGELMAGGFKLERDEEHPHVYWSVPKNWFPGALAFKPDEAMDVLRVVARAPRGELRERVLGVIVNRLSHLGQANATVDPDAVRPPVVAPEEEHVLSAVEDAAAKRTALEVRYFSASRRHESWRHVSVHRLELGERAQFIATCHRSGELRHFRVSNVLAARPDPTEPFRAASAEELARFDAESLSGFRGRGPAVTCTFFVRDPEAAWVARNLPDPRITQEPAPGGARFRVHTTAPNVLARFVVGLGEAAVPESAELAAEVATLARGALKNTAS